MWNDDGESIVEHLAGVEDRRGSLQLEGRPRQADRFRSGPRTFQPLCGRLSVR
jgi:hypothetical protein